MERFDEMNGAESLVRTLTGSGIDTCFSNPGTSEMHFVAALDRIPGIRCILGLQENVVTGMADGYFRVADRPAASLLHCGPGLANGMANLHNARRARSGVVNIVGDQATWHRPFDAPLTADTEGMARTLSDWVRVSTASAGVGRDAAEAVRAAARPGGGIATLILPSDASWNPGGRVAEALAPIAPAPVSAHAVEEAARMLRENGGSVLLLLGGRAVLEAGQRLAHRIAAATGASAMSEFVCARMPRGRGTVPLDRVPYVNSAARQALHPFDRIILVGAKPPVGFFGYPDGASAQYQEDARFHLLARPDQDPAEALEALADALGAPPAAIPDPGPVPEPGRGVPTPEGLARTVAAVIPEGTIISDESISYGRGFYPMTRAAPPHEWLHLTGGAIGDGLPVATGAAVAAGGGRRVLSLQADGSAMYSLQALWTQARERLPVTTLILANRRYNILINEYASVGTSPGPTAMNMLDLGDPNLDWVKLANGMGVEAARADTLETCTDILRSSFDRRGPLLIELAV